LNDGYYGSGKRIRRSLNKYGKENHKVEIFESLPDRKSLINREKEIVNLNEIAKNDCMNLMVGGEGGFISEEQQKYRSYCAGKAYGKRLKTDIAFRKKISKVRSDIAIKSRDAGIFRNAKNSRFTNKKHTEKTKERIGTTNSIKQKGEKNSQYNTCWITNGIINKKIKKCDISQYINSEWKFGRIT
jgi:hypothetical protein